MRVIVWNKFAKNDYFSTIDFLLKEWTEKEAQKFIDRVDELLYFLGLGIVDFQETNYPGIKRCIIDQHITLFYKIVNVKKIELLRFWNNKQDHAKLEF